MALYATGIQVVTLKLQNVNLRNPVKAAFNEVRREKERMINEVRQMYNLKISERNHSPFNAGLREKGKGRPPWGQMKRNLTKINLEAFRKA